MTTMIAELYEALVDAGASEGKAKEAAQVLSTENLATKGDIAKLDGDIAKLDTKLSELDQRLTGQIVKLDEKFSTKIVKLDRDMAVMKWMVGAALAGIAPILVAVVSMVIKIFFLA